MVRQRLRRRLTLADIVHQRREAHLGSLRHRRGTVEYQHRMLEGVAFGVVFRRLALAYEPVQPGKFLLKEPRGQQTAEIARGTRRAERLLKLGKFTLPRLIPQLCRAASHHRKRRRLYGKV